VALWGIPALALPQGDAITDPRTLLRRALPIQETKLLEIDEAISKIDADLKYNRWSAVRGDVRQVERLLDRYGIPCWPVAPRAGAPPLNNSRPTPGVAAHQPGQERKSKGKEEARAAYDRL